MLVNALTNEPYCKSFTNII